MSAGKSFDMSLAEAKDNVNVFVMLAAIVPRLPVEPSTIPVGSLVPNLLLNVKV